MKKSLRFAVFFVLAAILGATLSFLPASAAAYSTYTYSINGQPLSSPDAYTPDKVITSKDIGGIGAALLRPADITVDYNNKVYIADTGNNRILILDKYMKNVVLSLNTFNNDGFADALNAPEGVFISKPTSWRDGEIYVADTGNRRIVVFDYYGNFERVIDEPRSEIFDSDARYTPIALAVDSSGRIYVVSRDTYEGVISLNGDGSFSSIVAAQKTTKNFFDAIWERFQTAEQKAQNSVNLSSSFNNITIDDNDMIYVTTQNIDKGSQQSAITGKSKSGDYAPVKKLNPDGDDIMRRNGFYPPSGEVKVNSALTTTNAGAATGASVIVDVALGEEGTWSIVDQLRSHIFTYDKNGNLLFVFGDKGSQKGNIGKAAALCYQFADARSIADGVEGKLLVLDSSPSSVAITVYKRTQYGEILMTALRHTNNKEYDKAVDDWYNILQRNNNYDAAYVGIGDAMFREFKWEEAMDMYKTAHDVEDYSGAFKMYRKDVISKFIFLIIVVIAALLFGIAKFFGFAGKVNRKTALKKGKKSFGEEVIYVFHVIFHPFDGFWDLKHEKRGGVRGATFWLLLVVAAFIYQSFGTGYIVAGNASSSVAASAISQAVGIFVPLALFVTANWCLTTLFDGEGSFKDVYVATCYAAAPLSFATLLATIVSNFVTTSETGFVSLIMGVAWVWFGLLLFFGMMVTHDYSLGKNILTTIGTIVGMAIIMFLVILFSGLVMKMSNFVSNIATELSFRV
ncbi:MAG: YIP1 family protein [Clostridia bacterium]|nr:YIP1 family protein [Clostridia bacterium]